MKIISLLLVSLFVQPSFAQQLQVPANVEVVKVNGIAQGFNLFEQQHMVPLRQGRNVLTIQYSELFDDVDYDDHTRIKSALMVLVFNIAKQQALTLLTPYINDQVQAKQFADSPHFAIVDDENNNIAMELFDLDNYLAVTRNQEIAQQQSKNIEQIASVDSAKATPVTDHQASTHRPITKTELAQQYALDMLHYWWQQATDKQKMQFKSAISTVKDKEIK
ncbi:UPF0319 protein [Thalassotalea insulae]|uniref:UPF0319 protein n=1 Tax=Thalassotalea insulae TaxID=2056778 RepID=A0ABQ6GRJ2_9GAMM|nr:DUF2057 family protein [Thalassotalea insulae]GLX76776.1 UPF0319 protein [Thalassotalea insulae]